MRKIVLITLFALLLCSCNDKKNENERISQTPELVGFCNLTFGMKKKDVENVLASMDFKYLEHSEDYFGEYNGSKVHISVSYYKGRFFYGSIKFSYYDKDSAYEYFNNEKKKYNLTVDKPVRTSDGSECTFTTNPTNNNIINFLAIAINKTNKYDYVISYFSGDISEKIVKKNKRHNKE